MAGLTYAAVSGVKDTVIGNKRMLVRTVTFDSSYPTGGEPVTASAAGLKVVEQIIPHGLFRKSDATDAVGVSYTGTKLAAYRQKDPADTGGADIALPEVANTTDLSGYSGRVTLIGH